MSIISIGIPIPDRSALPGQTGSGEEVNLQYTTQNYCDNPSGQVVNPTVATPTGGIFTSSDPTNLPVSGGNGVFNLGVSNPGNYIVTYTVAGVGSANFPINITALDDASFSYSATSFCKDAPNQTPTITTSGGSFTTQDITFYPFQMQFEVANGVQTTITLGTTVGSNYTINWGDGATTTHNGGTPSHTYNDGNNSTVQNPIISIGAEGDSGPFTAIFMQNAPSRTLLMDIPQWGSIVWSNFQNSFRDCNNVNMQISATDGPDFSAQPNVELMLYQARLNNSDISHWDVTPLTNLSGMLRKISNWNVSINNWDISNATNLYALFFQTPYNQPLNSWDTSNVTNMASLFSNTSFNQDISNWDVSKVTNMNSIFNNIAVFDQDISGWDVSEVTDMTGAFQGTALTADISGWDVSKVTSMTNMLREVDEFNVDISGWNTVSNTSLMFTFYHSNLFNQNLSDWNILSITTADRCFYQTNMSTANYTDTIVGWAVQVYNNSNSPSNINSSGNNKTFDGTRTSDAAAGQSYSVKYSNWPSGWTDAQDAYDYLVNTANWSL